MRFDEQCKALSGAKADIVGHIRTASRTRVSAALERFFAASEAEAAMNDGISFSPLIDQIDHAGLIALWDGLGANRLADFASVCLEECSRLMPSSNDHGVDVVAKHSIAGELVQARNSQAEDAALSWNAVKDLVGGEEHYKRIYTGVTFVKVAVTNRHFNNNAKMQASLNSVRLVEREELSQMLEETRIVMADVQSFLDMPEQVA